MNIEKTISEQAVSDILTPMLESQDRIVTEDVAPLFDAATGLDTPPASGTVTTTIEESRSVITAIIRKAWTATLTMLGGASVISYIAAAYTYLRNRLQGNETYGIPDRRSEISASSSLAANLALLNDRKIGGVPEAVDGMSLVHLLCSDERLAITKLQDDNYGYENNMPIDITSFPNVNELTIGAERIDYGTPKIILTSQSVKTLHIAAKYARATFNIPADGTLDAPNLEEFFVGYGGGPNCETIYMPKLRKPNGLDIFRWWHTDSPLNMKIMILGSVESGSINNWLSGTADRLIHFEFGADGFGGLKISMNLSWWTATNCLDASRTDLIEEGSTAANNLEQFLQNFRDVLFTRLAQRTSTTSLTLTLSPEVYKAIYGLDADYNVDPNALAQTASLADFGITTEDLNDIEIAAGITTATKYATWLDTYRGAIYWNVQHS